MSTFKITTVTTHEETNELEVSLPYFFKYDDDFYKIISEESAIRIVTSRLSNYQCIAITQPGIFKKAIAAGIPCTEAEFEQARYETVSRVLESPAIPMVMERSVEENILVS